MEQIDAGAPGTASPQGPAIEARRRFLTRATSVAALGGMAALVGCGEGDESPLANYPMPTPSGTTTPTPTPTPTVLPVTDTDMLVLMAQLHYLQAEFYSRAVLGVPLAAALVTGTGTLGTVSGPRTVTFTDAVLAEGLREIAVEKIDQVVRLRAVLGGNMPARPDLNLGVDAAGTFARYGIGAAPVTTPATAPIITDVYANQDQLLLGAFILEDPVMTAWRAIATLMTSATNIDLAAGLLAISAHHVGMVRSQIFIRGAASGSTLRQASIRLSDLRDSYAPVDDDKGVAAGLTAATGLNTADIVPADGDGEIYGRLPNLTINTFYMTRSVATSGGFFPAGLNGVLRESALT